MSRSPFCPVTSPPVTPPPPKPLTFPTLVRLPNEGIIPTINPDDLDRENRSHLNEEARQQRDDGASPHDAVNAARRAFGNPTLVKEEIRSMSRWSSLEQSWQDVRYGARLLLRAPSVTFIAVL